MTVAWTVGDPEAYDQALAQGGNVRKQIGGWVWPTRHAVKQWLEARAGLHDFQDGRGPIPLVPYQIKLPGTYYQCTRSGKTGIDLLTTKAAILRKDTD